MFPRVSVAITTFNQAPYVAATIRSALGQSYTNCEIVVVDDGSTDDTARVVSQFGSAVRYIRQANRGVAAARNRAIEVARGDLIAFLDGDDLWEPSKIARQVEVYDQHPGVGLVAVDLVQFDGDRRLWERSFGETVFASSDAPHVVGQFYRDFVKRNLVATSSQVMSAAAVLRDVGPSRESLRIASDYDLYLRIASRYPVAFINAVLTRWRYLETRASGSAGVRDLRWTSDMLRALRGHVREARPSEVPLIQARIGELERELAWCAYQAGCSGRRREASTALVELIAHGRMRPAAYLAAVYLPSRVRRVAQATLGPLREPARSASADSASPPCGSTPSHADRIQVSVIVCTRDRASSLERCLAAFEAMDFDPTSWELVVVNNGSSDQTRSVVELFATRVPFHVVLLDEPERGKARALNRGARHAAAPILTFIDDDCYAAPDFLTCVLEGFAEHADCGYIGGRILLFDPTDAPLTIKLDDVAEEVPPHTCVKPGFIQGANLSVRRQVWAGIGGFDPMFGPGQRFIAEDIDFIGRASAAGWKGWYLPGPVVSHHHGRKPGPDIERLLVAYAKGRGAYYMKGCLNPRMRGLFLRGWYWHLRMLMKNHDVGPACRELAAGIEYLWCRFTIAQTPVDVPRTRE
jgi:glycosyltransferase involved in cell wall biosynthesis